MDEQLFSLGDGLPVVAVTKEKLISMLARTNRDPSEVIGTCPPSYNEVTVEKVASNAVLAGCKPEYFPIVLASLEAVLSKQYNLHGVHATTMGATPCLIVRGEIASEVGLNSGCGSLGSGSRANATIGRCVKLVLSNVGEAKLGGTESTTLGTPMKYTFCVTENVEAMKKYNFDTNTKSENTVTAISVTSGPHQIVDFKTRTCSSLIDLLCKSLVTSYNWYAPMINEVILFLSPEHLQVLESGGIKTKEELQKRIWTRCNSIFVWAIYRMIRTQYPTLLGLFLGVLLQFIGVLSNAVFGRGLWFLPKFSNPESIEIVVCGGEAGKFSSFCPGFGIGRPGMPTYHLSQRTTTPIAKSLTPTEIATNLDQLNMIKQDLDVSPLANKSNSTTKSASVVERKSGDLKGVVGLVDISKPMGNFFLDKIEKLMEKEYPLVQVKRYTKATFSRPMVSDLRKLIVSECDYVIQGLAD